MKSEKEVDEKREVEGVEWREVALEVVCWIRREDVICVKDEHVKPGEVKLTRWDRCGMYRFYPGDILVRIVGARMVDAVLSGVEGICSDNFVVINPKDDRVIPDYLVFFFHTSSFRRYLMEIAHGAAIMRVSVEDLLEVKVPLPFRNGQMDLETQKEMADRLHGHYGGMVEEGKKGVLEEAFGIG